jgi:hypothetical protein
MDADDAVAAHFKKRVDRSLSMTGFVTGNCAGIVHWELAARCRTKLASLRRLVPARRPQIHAVVLQQEIEDRRQVLPSTPNRIFLGPRAWLCVRGLRGFRRRSCADCGSRIRSTRSTPF